MLRKPQLTVIADDLTGATDTGIAFANAGLETIVHLLPIADPSNHPCDVLVLSTHSRHLAPDDARAKVASALQPFRAQQNALPWIYKKIDSTLRGHPGPELAATLETLAQQRCLLAPAFPAQGRTTRNGQHFVGRVPLADTIFGQEVPTSTVADLFAQLAPNYPHHPIDLATIRNDPPNLLQKLNSVSPALFIADAETETDLQTLTDAAVAAQIRLFCGSAGLANALTKTLDLQPITQGSSKNDEVAGAALAVARGQTRPQPMLIVAGTRNPQTERQIERLLTQNAMHIQPQSLTHPSAIERDLQSMREALAQTDTLVISTAGLELGMLTPQMIAQRLGEVVKRLLAELQNTPRRLQALVLTGGDTAMGTCMALDSSAIRLRGEIEAGVPYGELIDGPYAGLRLVTKAGGFGSDEVLIRAVEILAE